MPRKGGASRFPIETKQFAVRYAKEKGVERAASALGISEKIVQKWVDTLDPEPGAYDNEPRVLHIGDPQPEIKSKRQTVRELKELRTNRNALKCPENRDLKSELVFHLETLKQLSTRTTVNFRDFEDVTQRTENYFEACFKAGVVPSIMGLATRGYGVERQALKKYIESHNDEISAYLRQVLDVIADIITDNGYKDMKSITMGIFQLKNHYGHADKVEIKTTPKFEEELSVMEIEKRYTQKGEVLEPMKDITPKDNE